MTRALCALLVALVLDQRPRVPPMPTRTPAQQARVSLHSLRARVRQAQIDCTLYLDAVSFGADEDRATTEACSALCAQEIPESDLQVPLAPKQEREETAL